MKGTKKDSVGDNHGMRNLVDFLARDSKPNWRNKTIAIEDINILAQVRKTIEVDKLAANIEALGNIAPILIVEYDREGALAYVKTVNEEWGTSYHVEDLKSINNNGEKYYIIIAGHRRLQAMVQIGEKKAKARVAENLPPFEVLFLQLSENLHMPVPKHEEVTGQQRLFRLIRKYHSDFTFAEYAPHVGASIDQLREGAKYVDLPEVIQRAVEEGKVCFGVAVAFDQLIKRFDLDEKVRAEFESKQGWVDWLVANCLVKAIIDRSSIKKFAVDAQKDISTKLSRQLDMFKLEGEVEKVSVRNFSNMILRKTAEGILSAVKYLSNALDHFSGQGALLRVDESPFYNRKFCELFLEFVKLLDKVIVHLRFLSEEEKKTIRAKTGEAIAQLEKRK
jgi:hypothetical protein